MAEGRFQQRRSTLGHPHPDDRTRQTTDTPGFKPFTIKPKKFLFLLQVTGKCGSVRVRLIPAPRGTGIVSAPVPKKLLTMAGIEDCYTSARGATKTLGNFG